MANIESGRSTWHATHLCHSCIAALSTQQYHYTKDSFNGVECITYSRYWIFVKTLQLGGHVGRRVSRLTFLPYLMGTRKRSLIDRGLGLGFHVFTITLAEKTVGANKWYLLKRNLKILDISPPRSLIMHKINPGQWSSSGIYWLLWEPSTLWWGEA